MDRNGLCSFNKKPIAWRCPVLFVVDKNRTPSKYVGYALYFYFSGLSLRRRASKILSSYFIKRNHVSVWNWGIQKYHPNKIFTKRRKRISEYMVDETLLKVGSEYIWLWWVAIEPINRQVLVLSISKERNMFVAERGLFWVWWRIMESILLFPQMEAHDGIHRRLVDF